MKMSLSILVALLFLYIGRKNETQQIIFEPQTEQASLQQTDESIAPQFPELHYQFDHNEGENTVFVGINNAGIPFAQLILPLQTEVGDTIKLTNERLHIVRQKSFQLTESYFVVQAHHQNQWTGLLTCWLRDTAGSYWVIRRQISVVSN